MFASKNDAGDSLCFSLACDDSGRSGAGSFYFTMPFAKAVGPQGKVYAFQR